MKAILHLSGIEVGIYDGWVNTKAADAMAPCVARPSAALVLTMQDKYIIVVHNEWYQWPGLYQWWKMIGNEYIVSYIP